MQARKLEVDAISNLTTALLLDIMTRQQSSRLDSLCAKLPLVHVYAVVERAVVSSALDKDKVRKWLLVRI
jgi:hypothetical protein